MKKVVFVLCALLFAFGADAKVKLPAVLGSNMVLQRNTEVNFWGDATPGSRVVSKSQVKTANSIPHRLSLSGGRIKSR